jgi:transposase-like protein
MDLSKVFCPNGACADKGKCGAGNIVSHGRKRQRCKCKTCGKTLAYRRGTVFEGLRTDEQTVTLVVTLLGHGCPRPAIVAAFGLDERTVADWQARAGQQAQRVHEHQVRPLALGQVQVDEIRLKLQGVIVWVAMAIAVGSRLWLGAAVSEQRDKALIQRIAAVVRAWALPGPLLIAFDGFAAYPNAFLRAFRDPLRTGHVGRPRLVVWAQLTLVQVVKHTTRGGFSVSRFVVHGSCTMLRLILRLSQGAGVINTAFIERLHATFRACFAPFVRRTRALARQPQTVQSGVFLVGCLYNFCSPHRSLDGQTPAMAAGLTDHVWSVSELLWYRVPPTCFPSTT